MDDGQYLPERKSAMDDDHYLSELLTERERLGPSYVHCTRLLAKEIELVRAGKPKNGPEQAHLTDKVFVPAKDFPGYNFVGRLLGPRGLTLKRMQSETGCRLTIMGRGSVRDAVKEEEFRTSGDPKYDHLNEDLHVLVEAKGTENIASARLAAGVAEVRKMLIPGDANDQIRNEQLRELALLNGLKEQTDTLVSAQSDSDLFQAAPPQRSRPMLQSRQPEIYATAGGPADYAPVVMVSRGYDRMPAYAKAPSFEAAYGEQAVQSRRYGEYIPADHGSFQMVPMARPSGGGGMDSWAKGTSSRSGKRFHPYATSAAHY